MTVQDFDKYMALAKVLNNSWGTGSQLKSQSQSIKFSLRDDKLLKANFIMIVNMPNNQNFATEMKRRYKREALMMLQDAIKELSEKYEEQQEGKNKKITLKLLENSVNEGIELLTSFQYRPLNHAYYRLEALISID